MIPIPGATRWSRAFFRVAIRRLQHIPDAAHRLYHFFRETVIDLAPQVADINVDDVGQSVIVHIPDVLHDHRAAERTSTIAHQILQDAEFLRCELNISAVACDLAANAIEGEIAHLQTLRQGLSTAQQNAHASEQLDERKRLHQIIVGAAFQPFDAIIHGVPRAEDQYGRRDFAIADLLQYFEAVHIGKAQIQR